MCRYKCSNRDSQLLKEVDGAVHDICSCFKYCARKGGVESLHQFLDSLCVWEEDGIRCVDRWSSQLVGLVSTAVHVEDRQKMDNSMDSRSRKMQLLAGRGLWVKLPRSKATVLLLLDGESLMGDEAGTGREGVMGRSKRRRIAKVRE